MKFFGPMLKFLGYTVWLKFLTIREPADASRSISMSPTEPRSTSGRPRWTIRLRFTNPDPHHVAFNVRSGTSRLTPGTRAGSLARRGNSRRSGRVPVRTRRLLCLLLSRTRPLEIRNRAHAAGGAELPAYDRRPRTRVALTMRYHALSDVRVVDLTHLIAGP